MANTHVGSSPTDHTYHLALRSLGLDLVGPFKKAPEGFTHLLMVIDMFTKWIEAKPIAKFKSSEVATFFCDIVYQFGLPNSIITDNGT